MSYEVIYKLKPHYEVYPGWWKLKWRPIFGVGGTWYVWSSGYFRPFNWRICSWLHVYQNGWGRSYKHFAFDVMLAGYSFDFWILWDFVVMAEGPGDVSVKRPLDLSGVKNASR